MIPIQIIPSKGTITNEGCKADYVTFCKFFACLGYFA